MIRGRSLRRRSKEGEGRCPSTPPRAPPLDPAGAWGPRPPSLGVFSSRWRKKSVHRTDVRLERLCEKPIRDHPPNGPCLRRPARRPHGRRFGRARARQGAGIPARGPPVGPPGPIRPSLAPPGASPPDANHPRPAPRPRPRPARPRLRASPRARLDLHPPQPRRAPPRPYCVHRPAPRIPRSAVSPPVCAENTPDSGGDDSRP